MIVASGQGGMEIEEISEKSPESIVRSTVEPAVEPAVGLREFQAREIAFKLGIPADLTQQMVRTLLGCYRAFRDLDASMVEVQALKANPLDMPAIVRLAGTNVGEGLKILAKSGLPIIRATSLMEAAERSVIAWRNDQAQRTKVRAAS